MLLVHLGVRHSRALHPKRWLQYLMDLIFYSSLQPNKSFCAYFVMKEVVNF